MPRPAMLVATVTAPRRPACAMISASLAWYFALSTACGDAAAAQHLASRISEFSTLTVPTSTGWPGWCRSTMSSTTALNFAFSVL